MLIPIYDHSLRSNDLQRITDCLQHGGVIVYPTDSVYAFGCDAANKNAIEIICRLRNKDMKHPLLSIMCENIAQVRTYALFSDDTFKLMKQYLPGPYTFILEGSSRLPKLFKNRRTVGIRIPANPVAQQLIAEYGNPLMTASLRTQPHDDVEYMTDPELIEERYRDDVSLVLSDGIGGTKPSTIIDCTNGENVIVRA